MLTGRSYFLASLALPLVAPLIVASLTYMTSNEVVAGFAAIFMFSLMLGGIPYSVFVAGVLLWSRRQSLSAIRKLSYVAPFLFVIVTAALSPVALIFGIPVREVFAFIALFSLYALVFGYLYVFMVNALYEFVIAKPS